MTAPRHTTDAPVVTYDLVYGERWAVLDLVSAGSITERAGR